MYKKIGLFCSIVLVVAFYVPTYGLEFSPPVIVNQGVEGVCQQATMDVDAQGNIYAAWIHKDTQGWNSGSELYFGMSSDNGATWTSPSIVVIDPEPQAWWRVNPSLKVGSDGSIYITWSLWLVSTIPSQAHLWCSVSHDTGATWDHYQVTDDIWGGKMYSSLIIDQNDDLYVIWEDERYSYECCLPYFARSTDAGQTWFPPPNVMVGQPPFGSHSYSGARMVIDASGILYAVFPALLGGGVGNGWWDVYLSKSTDGGLNWSPSFSIDPNAMSNDANPDIACDAAGNLYVVWYDETDDYTYFSKSIDGGLSWSAKTTVVENDYWWPLSRIILDDLGNIYIVYGTDKVYLTMSFDDGNTWTEPSCVNDTIEFSIDPVQLPSAYVADGIINVSWSDGDKWCSSSNIYFTSASTPVLVSVPDTTYGVPGYPLEIPVNTQDLTGLGVVSAEFDLTYNSDILTGIEVDTTGTLLSGTDWTFEYNVVGNTFSVNLSGTNTLAGIGTLINLIFDVSPAAQPGQESPLHFEYFMFNQGNPPVNTQDGVFVVESVDVDDEESAHIPKIFTLNQNYPNPFNPQTTISFSVAQTLSFVNLEVYNIKGQKVKTLIGEKLPAGPHQVIWDGKDDNNKSVSSGIYFYRITSGEFTDTKKCIILK